MLDALVWAIGIQALSVLLVERSLMDWLEQKGAPD